MLNPIIILVHILVSITLSCGTMLFVVLVTLFTFLSSVIGLFYQRSKSRLRYEETPQVMETSCEYYKTINNCSMI